MEQKEIKLMLAVLLKSLLDDYAMEENIKDTSNKSKLVSSNSVTVLPHAAITPESVKTTINCWMDIYEENALSQSEYKEQTIRNRRGVFKHIRKLWGDSVLTELKPFEITSKLKTIKESSPCTAQRILAELRQMYQEAIANNYAEGNPALHVKNFKVKVLRKRLSWETWKAMYVYSIEDCTQRWVPIMLLLALITGQRRADLARMKYSDISNGYLYIEQQKQAGKGYGARVALPLNLKLVGLKLTLGDVIIRSRRTAPKGETILRKSNGLPLELSSLSISFMKCLKAVVPEDKYIKGERPSLHEIRSLSARRYHAQGVDTQTLLGHKHAEMTAVYEDSRGLDAHKYKKLVFK